MIKAIKPKGGERVTNRVAWRILSGDGYDTDLLLREEMRARNWLPGQRFKSLSCQQPRGREEENVVREIPIDLFKTSFVRSESSLP